MNKKGFKELKQFVKALTVTYSIKDLVAEIYNLFQDYLINQNQEEELYSIVDPDNTENCPGDLWFTDQYGCFELYDYATICKGAA